MNYKVVKGDTLSKIANRFGTSVKVIQKANPSITNPNIIKVGKIIKIPTTVENNSKGYESIGKAFQKALKDVSELDSVKELEKLL